MPASLAVEVGIELRLRRTEANTGAGAIYVELETNSAFTASTTEGTGATVASGYLGQHGWFFPATTNRFEATTQGLFIQPGGNVGIGTTSPGELLHLSKAGAHGIKFERTGASARTYDIGVGLGGNTPATAFAIVDRTAALERLVIDSSGNVGIGTAGPNARLTVIHPGETATSYTARFQSSPTTSGAGGILFDQGSTYGWKVHTDNTGGTSGQLRFNFINVGTGAVQNADTLVLNAGNVGIGTTNPSEKLEVFNGNIVVDRSNSGAKEGLVMLSNGGFSRPTCDASIQGAITYEQSAGTNNGHFFGCRGAGGGSYVWVQLDN